MHEMAPLPATAAALPCETRPCPATCLSTSYDQ